MMLSLGMFAFGLDSLAYQELARKSEYRHEQTKRVGSRDANQFLGPGADKISLTGYVVPEFKGDPASIETLRDMASGGDTWPLVDGNGSVLGNFVILGIDERQQLFFEDGTPRRRDFTIDLHMVDG